MRAIMAALMACFLTSVATAKEQTPPPPAPSEPDWSQAREASEASLRSMLIDPSSAQIEWTNGFHWGYYKPFMSGKILGWMGCGTVNSKNRLGGYVGASAFIVVYDGGVMKIDIDEKYPAVGRLCSDGSFPPLQTAFLKAPSPKQDGGGSVADEIAKLADLKARGVLTQAEFDAQKAKLLAQ